MKKLTASALAALLSSAIVPAQAIDFGKIPSLGAKNNNATGGASAAEVAKNTRNSLVLFTNAEIGLLAALGGYETLAADRAQAEGMAKGDAGVDTAQLESIVKLHKTASAELEKKLVANASLDAEQKKQAAKSMLVYVQGLASAKQTLASLQGVAKNPMALGSDAGSVLYVAKELPSVVSSGVSTTGTLFKYLGANGVDMSASKSVADTMGK